MKYNKKFEGIIFDMDGTITVPSIDFSLIREELGILSGDLVEVINSWSPVKRKNAWQIIEQHEREGIKSLRFQDGCHKTLENFSKANIKLALLTRNSKISTEAVMKKLQIEFDPVITREYDFIKPSPEPVLHILKAWNCDMSKAMIVGDYIHDIQSGKDAGINTCFFHNDGANDFSVHADFSIRSFKELEDIVLQ